MEIQIETLEQLLQVNLPKLRTIPIIAQDGNTYSIDLDKLRA